MNSWRFMRRWVDYVRNPPDLIERAPAVQFVISVFPDNTGGITATKLVAPTAPEITAMTQAAFNLLMRWAQSQGVQIQVQSTAPAKNPLRGVRPS